MKVKDALYDQWLADKEAQEEYAWYLYEQAKLQAESFKGEVAAPLNSDNTKAQNETRK